MTLYMQDIFSQCLQLSLDEICYYACSSLVGSTDNCEAYKIHIRLIKYIDNNQGR